MKHITLYLLLLLLMGAAVGLYGQQNALEFNPGPAPDNDYVLIGTNVYNQAFNGLSGFSFEGWIYPTSLVSGTGRNRMISLQRTTGTVALYVGLTNSGAVEVGARSTNETYQVVVTPTGSVAANTWTHIAAVVDFTPGSKSISVYINGVGTTTPIPFASNTYVPGTGSTDIIGLHPSTLPLFTEQFYGYMDEYRIWSYPRTLAQITADMFTEQTGTETGLIGYWPFNESTGTTAVDYSPSGNNGTLINFRTSPVPWVPGNQQIQPPYTLPVELSSFTANPTSQYFIQLHWVTQSETDVMGYYVQRSSNNQLANAIVVSPMIQATNTSAQVAYSFVDQEVTPGTWYYWLQIIDLDGSESFHGPIVCTLTNPGEGGVPDLPIDTLIKATYPNPFNPVLYVDYSVAAATNVEFDIYNTRGQLMYSSHEGFREIGDYRLTWNGKDTSGTPCPAGIYMIKMTAGNLVSQTKVVLSK